MAKITGKLELRAKNWAKNDSLIHEIHEMTSLPSFLTSVVSDHAFFNTITPLVTNVHNAALTRPFEECEVKDALFSMFPNKAPGPDGMNPCFYQQFWDVVGQDVSLFALNCLHTGQFPDGLCDANVVLIPKKGNPKFVTDLRPIALCNVVYKLMAKMLANKIKFLFDEIISESQSVFVPGRLITDNILVAVEVGHFLNRNQLGKVGWGVLKLDMAKAYDRMEWSFLRRMMEEAIVVKECLQTIYEMLSGQVVNFHKSSICFSKNTAAGDRDDVAAVLGVSQAANFGKYLGLPSFVGRNKWAVFSYIEDKIRHRISSWDKKLLSRRGKEVLLKSVAQAMPTFSMSVFRFPDSLCMAIERAMNRFWWGSGTSKGIHWLAWDCLCPPKKFGGLGFRDLRSFNLGMLGKQAWRFLTRPHCMVARLYKARYYPTTSFMDATVDGPDPMIHTVMPPNLQGSTVSGLIDPITNTWDLSILRDIFLPVDVDRIVKIPVSPTYDDSWYWVGEPNGCYTVKSGYRKLVGEFITTPGGFDKWKQLWKLKVPLSGGPSSGGLSETSSLQLLIY
ncbi:uncharacterized protein LOC116010884 [Ipomoea triloba]|uniref:uncharacterized protein LOC116010884 n=1 Tax=Ipomoea triloba TaxID=35885 RepID=UPI00125D089F|nr:uncharacterized protein LOC116010884 [Ipomoea triloba]